MVSVRFIQSCIYICQFNEGYYFLMFIMMYLTQFDEDDDI